MGIRKGDLLVVAAILVFAVLLLGLKSLPAASGGQLLRVELNKRVVREIPFDENSNETIVIELPAGEATVEIVAGRVRILAMPKEICPLGICSSVGWVEQSGDAIVCLPNRLVLTVVGGMVNEVWESLDGVTK